MAAAFFCISSDHITGPLALRLPFCQGLSVSSCQCIVQGLSFLVWLEDLKVGSICHGGQILVYFLYSLYAICAYLQDQLVKQALCRPQDNELSHIRPGIA